MPELVISPDERQAEIVLAEGERMTSAQALVFLSKRGVRYGQQPTALAALQEAVGPATLVVALADPGEPTVDARIETPIGNTAFAYEPALTDDGQLRFPDPPLPPVAVPGEVVAAKVPGAVGRVGRTVTGKPLGEPPPAPRDVTLVAGKGTELAGDGRRVVAAIAGNPRCIDGIVETVPERKIEGDLTAAIGDVDFDGNVLVTGDIEIQRRIRATGDITILGGVEGAILQAGRRIVVHGGVRNEARLTATDAVLVRFIEGSTVRSARRVIARGDVTHCHLEDVGELIAGGSVVGGTVQLRERLEAWTLGGPLQTATRISVVPPPPPPDPRPAIIKERQEHEARLAQVRIRLDEAQRVAQRRANDARGEEALEMLRQLSLLYRSLVAQGEEIQRRLERAACVAPPALKPSATVRGEIWPGTTLQLGSAQLRVETSYPPCVVLEEHGALQIVPLEQKGAHP